MTSKVNKARTSAKEGRGLLEMNKVNANRIDGVHRRLKQRQVKGNRFSKPSAAASLFGQLAQRRRRQTRRLPRPPKAQRGAPRSGGPGSGLRLHAVVRRGRERLKLTHQLAHGPPPGQGGSRLRLRSCTAHPRGRFALLRAPGLPDDDQARALLARLRTATSE